MDGLEIALGLSMFGVAVLSMVGTAIWTVGNVRRAADASVASVQTTTAVLGERIDNLTNHLDRICGKLDNYADAIRDLEHRTTLLEERCNRQLPDEKHGKIG